MTDLATLVLAVDSTQVGKGAAALDGLTASGRRAEASATGAATGFNSVGAAASRMAANAQVSSAAAVGMATGMKSAGMAANNARIAMLDMTHVGINLTQMLASGVNPMRALVMESGRIATAVQYSSGGIGGLVRQTAKWIGVLKVTQNAELAEEAANASAAATAVRSAAQRAASAIVAADTELALAQAAVRVATTSEAETAAQAQVAAAHQAVAAAAGEATVAENALAVAERRAGQAAVASAAATTVALGPIAGILVGVAVAAGLVIGGFKAFQAQVHSTGELDRYANSLGLTTKEMKKLRQEVGGLSSKEMQDLDARLRAFQITWGDVWNGLNKTASDALDLSPAWQKFKRDAADAFSSAMSSSVTAAAYMYGVWNASIDRLGPRLKFLSQMIGNAFRGFGGMPAPPKDSATAFWDDVGKNAAEAQKEISGNLATIRGNIIGAAEKRIKTAADAIKEDRTPKKPKKESDHGLADARAQLDAQIKGQRALAAAYQVSDAAAIKAEALQKAEEQAIRHKGQVGIFYEKELALAVATRAADGARVIADLRFEADARKRVNDAVAAGRIPVEQANAALQLESTLRPLVAAAAATEGGAKQKILGIIKSLTKSQDDLNRQLAREAALREIAANDNDIERLRLEATLIGHSNRERAVALAQLEAMRKIKAEGTPPDLRAGLIRQATEKAELSVRTPFQDWAASIPQTAEAVNEALQSVQVRGFDNLASSITDVVTGTKSLGAAFKDVARSIVADLIQMTVRMLIFRAVSSIFGSFNGGLGQSAFPVVGGVDPLAPRAAGGPVSPSGSYLVGERGPELFVPNAPGRIVPHVPADSNGAGGVVEVRVSLDSTMLRAEIVNGATGVVVQSAPAIAGLAERNVSRTLSRPRLMGGHR